MSRWKMMVLNNRMEAGISLQWKGIIVDTWTGVQHILINVLEE